MSINDDGIADLESEIRVDYAPGGLAPTPPLGGSPPGYRHPPSAT